MTQVTTRRKPPSVKPPIKPLQTRRLFVYGTLKEGFPLNKGWLEGGKLVGKDAITGFAMISLGNYPALIKMWSSNLDAEDQHVTTGEVWEVPEETYACVREMEEDAGYTTMSVVTDSGQRVDVFILGDFTEGKIYTWTVKHHKQGKLYYDVETFGHDYMPF